MLGCKVQLFTVTRIGHAKEVGSTNVAKAFEAFDPNVISKCRSKNMGFIGMIKNGCLPCCSEEGQYPSVGYSVESGGAEPTERNDNNQ